MFVGELDGELPAEMGGRGFRGRVHDRALRARVRDGCCGNAVMLSDVQALGCYLRLP